MCRYFSGRMERFRRTRCGTGAYFAIGDRADWSYLLPARLGARPLRARRDRDRRRRQPHAARARAHAGGVQGPMRRAPPRAAWLVARRRLRLRRRRGDGRHGHRDRVAGLRRGARSRRRCRETAREGETVMRLLQRSFDVQTRFGGNFVQEIDGISGGREGGRRVDWFYYVNGIESSEGAGERRLYPGDRVWWDHHDWEARCASPPSSAPSRSRSGRAPAARSCRSGSSASRPGALVRRGRDAAARRRRAQHRALEPRVLAGRGPARPRRPLERGAPGHHGAPARGGPGGVRRLRAAGCVRAPDRAARRRGAGRAHARPGVGARGGDELRGAAADVDRSPGPTTSASPRPRRR